MARILVVDDEKSIQILLSELLTRDSHEVKTAGSGGQACAMIEKEDFDLVISDLHMARHSGIQVLEAAKKRDPLTEVLILTGHGSISSA
ncbi:MAG: response regulator, partial [Calditrichaeota bacterium]